jgi:hypothetical protein
LLLLPLLLFHAGRASSLLFGPRPSTDLEKYKILLDSVCLGMKALVQIRKGLVCGTYGIEKLQYQLLAKLVEIGSPLPCLSVLAYSCLATILPLKKLQPQNTK